MRALLGSSARPFTRAADACLLSRAAGHEQAIEDAIGRLDVPSAAPKNLDFTVDLLVGTDAENPVSGSIPKDLESVVAQLKGAFPFKNYRQLDVLTLRTRAGKQARTESSGGVVQLKPGPLA